MCTYLRAPVTPVTSRRTPQPRSTERVVSKQTKTLRTVLDSQGSSRTIHPSIAVVGRHAIARSSSWKTPLISSTAPRMRCVAIIRGWHGPKRWSRLQERCTTLVVTYSVARLSNPRIVRSTPWDGAERKVSPGASDEPSFVCPKNLLPGRNLLVVHSTVDSYS
jgi:hypothetical protein